MAAVANDNEGGPAGRANVPCPICSRPAEPKLRPFCSPRCADIDLSRWLGGKYAIAGHADAEEDEAAPAVMPDQTSEDEG
jgi:hypothetical protein